MIAALLLALAAQVAADSEVLTVADLAARHRELAGRTVQVEGVLAECQPLSCGLLGQPRGELMSWLSFESAQAFDTTAQAHLHHKVVVEGVVLSFNSAGERSPDGSPYAPCFDRCSEFRPIRVVRDLDTKQDMP